MMTKQTLERSRLTFDLSAKVAHIGSQSIYQKIVFSVTTRPIELKFNVKIPYNMLDKMYSNCFGNMTKMAARPVYV